LYCIIFELRKNIPLINQQVKSREIHQYSLKLNSFLGVVVACTQPSSGNIDDGLTVYPNSTTKRITNVDTLVLGFSHEIAPHCVVSLILMRQCSTRLVEFLTMREFKEHSKIARRMRTGLHNLKKCMHRVFKKLLILK